jgi:hypothetical protein
LTPTLLDRFKDGDLGRFAKGSIFSVLNDPGDLNPFPGCALAESPADGAIGIFAGKEPVNERLIHERDQGSILRVTSIQVAAGDKAGVLGLEIARCDRLNVSAGDFGGAALHPALEIYGVTSLIRRDRGRPELIPAA